MESKSSNEKKDESQLDEVFSLIIFKTVNTQKSNKRIIFLTQTIPQSSSCAVCLKYKCGCKKIFPEQKQRSDCQQQIINNNINAKSSTK